MQRKGSVVTLRSQSSYVVCCCAVCDWLTL
uniref:Uncharacterized protein n=1 Tax=Anguilla anguilla TaxID=7936 RepID=A0A0E9QHT3_ANGAN